MVFLMTGLQARAVIAGIRGHSLLELTTSAALVGAAVTFRAGDRRGPANACAEGSQRVADCDPSA